MYLRIDSSGGFMTVFLPIISGKLFSNEAQEHFFSDISSNRKKKSALKIMKIPLRKMLWECGITLLVIERV